jgi:class 3 adenylate cyclase
MSGFQILEDEERSVAASRYHLVFEDATVEADYQRFRMEGRYGGLAALTPINVAYHAISLYTYATVRQLHPSALLAHVVGATISAIVTPLVIMLWLSHRWRETWCSGDTSVPPDAKRQLLKREIARAVWTERIQSYGYAGCIVLMAYSQALRVAQRCEEDYPDDEGCKFQRQAFVVVSMMTMYMAIRPRIYLALPLCVVALIPPLYLGVYEQGQYAVTDYIAMTIVVCVALAACTNDVWVTEQFSRQHFLHALQLVRADARIEQLMTATRKIIKAELPQELLDTDTAVLDTTRHRSPHASVAICEIYDFTQWSTGLLVSSVVVVLHGLLGHFGTAAEKHGVVRAMSYGDSYVVCAGLASRCSDHAERVKAWVLAAIAVDTAGWDNRLSLHGSTCAGPLQGSLSGKQSLRYVVSGAAFDVATAALREAPPGKITCEEIAAKQSLSASMVDSSVTGIDARRGGAYREHGDELDVASVHARQTYSAVSLLFTDDDTRRGMVAFLAEGESGVARFTAVTPFAVLGSFLTILLVELAAAEPSRRTTNPVPYVGLVLGMFICGLGFAVGMRELLPNVDYVLRFFGLAIGMASLFFSNSSWAAPFVYVAAYGATTMFARLPWLAQLTLQLLCLAFPTIAYAALGRYNAVSGWEFAIAMVLVLVIFVRYTSSRALCDQYAAALLAQSAVSATLVKSEHQHALLAGVLPPHAIAIAKGRIAAGVEQGYVNEWQGLSVLQVVTRGIKAVDLPAVLALVNGDGLLEVVQTMGDTYLIAGPFKHQANDEAKHQAAICAVTFLAALRTQLEEPRGGFTAVATAGPAYGALIGAANLTFRLFGAAVRENIALLAASPQPDTLLSWAPSCVAFCTDGFRRQHANYVPVKTKKFDAEPGMSIAVGGRSAVFAASDTVQTAVASGARGTTSTGPASPPAGVVVFGEPAMWRVRSVGVASVRTIVLDGARTAATSGLRPGVSFTAVAARARTGGK